MNDNLPQKLFNGNNLPKINSGQEALFLLIGKKLKQKEIIEYEEVKKIYIAKVKTSNQKADQCWDNEKGQWDYRYREYNDWEIDNMVNGWLLRALGALIKKGYLMVIPRIELKKQIEAKEIIE